MPMTPHLSPWPFIYMSWRTATTILRWCLLSPPHMSHTPLHGPQQRGCLEHRQASTMEAEPHRRQGDHVTKHDIWVSIDTTMLKNSKLRLGDVPLPLLPMGHSTRSRSTYAMRGWRRHSRPNLDSNPTPTGGTCSSTMANPQAALLQDWGVEEVVIDARPRHTFYDYMYKLYWVLEFLPNQLFKLSGFSPPSGHPI
jgi:hypothetical protein